MGLYSRDKKDTDPYNISPIEMRSHWMEIKYIWNDARLLNRDWVNKGGLDLSKEVLWVSVGQRAAVLLAVKVRGEKKSADQPRAGQVGSNRGDRQRFYLTSNFDSL